MSELKRFEKRRRQKNKSERRERRSFKILNRAKVTLRATAATLRSCTGKRFNRRVLDFMAQLRVSSPKLNGIAADVICIIFHKIKWSGSSMKLASQSSNIGQSNANYIGIELV